MQLEGGSVSTSDAPHDAEKGPKVESAGLIAH